MQVRWQVGGCSPQETSLRFALQTRCLCAQESAPIGHLSPVRRSALGGAPTGDTCVLQGDVLPPGSRQVGLEAVSPTGCPAGVSDRGRQPGVPMATLSLALCRRPHGQLPRGAPGAQTRVPVPWPGWGSRRSRGLGAGGPERPNPSASRPPGRAEGKPVTVTRPDALGPSHCCLIYGRKVWIPGLFNKTLYLVASVLGAGRHASLRFSGRERTVHQAAGLRLCSPKAGGGACVSSCVSVTCWPSRPPCPSGGPRGVGGGCNPTS